MVDRSGTDRPFVVVSIATIPSRIASIRPTLESLLAGELVPDQILVNTPEYCRLEKSGYDIPSFLTDAAQFGGRVRHVSTPEDWGPGTKILGPLPHLPPQCVLIIADDDIIYHRSFVRMLAESQLRRKDHSFSFYVYRSSGLTIGQGCDGLSIWSPHLKGIEDFARQYVVGTTLLYHDDIWIAFFLAIKGVKVSRLRVPSGAELVYEQVLPNDVLAKQTGELKRERILAMHLPRLLQDVQVPVPLRIRFFSLKTYDGVSSLLMRGMRKASQFVRWGH